MARLIDQTDYCRDLLQALVDEGIAVEQLHPEYAAGQLELSVAAESPVAAADTSVLVRRRSGPSAGATASGRRSRRRWRSRVWAMVATCTSACGAARRT